MNLRRIVAVGIVGSGLAWGAAAQEKADAPAVTLSARLVNPEKNAARGTATVEVKVAGVDIVDPASTGETVKKGEAHFHYRVDDGPVVATTAPKLSFHDLKPGSHRVKVQLAANDHTPLGVEQTLDVQIVGAGK